MSSGAFLVASVFLACAVEAVEALTVVLAVGVTRGWRSAGIGVLAALGALAVVVAALGPALRLLPLSALRLVVGGLLLVFGLQWLRKAILRAGGVKALHDEAEIYARQVATASAALPGSGGTDWYAFTLSFKAVFLEGLEVAFIVVTFGTLSFKAVFLEGLEVAFIVVTFGANAGSIPLAIVGAAAAVTAVVVIGVAVRAPLTRVPENTMKFAVGVLLTSFGIFWGAEGAGARWPGTDVALLGLIPFVAATAIALVTLLRRGQAGAPPAGDALPVETKAVG